MPDRSVDFLLIGGGIAAANCAARLRDEGADGSILLVGREPDPPYDRPPLSKGYLQGEAGKQDALFEPEDWWGEHEIELATRTSVMKLDLEQRVAKLSTKEEVGFEKALMATGANVQRLKVDGSDLDGIHYLRAFANADAIRADAAEAERAAAAYDGGVRTYQTVSAGRFGQIYDKLQPHTARIWHDAARDACEGKLRADWRCT